MRVVSKFMVQIVLLLAVGLLSACGGGTSPSGDGDGPKIVSISVSASNTAVSTNSEIQLSVVATYDNDDVEDIVSDIVWASDNADIASISATGLLSSGDTDGTVTISATLNDVVGEITITVQSGEIIEINVAPVIADIPNVTITEGQSYNQSVVATDENTADVLSFSLENAPGGMSINSTTGNISWSPSAADIGSYLITVKVSDNELSASLKYLLVVEQRNTEINVAPVITGIPNATTIEGQPYSQRIVATDENAADVLLFSLENAPGGMSINSTTGNISWSPSAADIGSYLITVKVSDNELSASLKYLLVVELRNIAPVIESVANVVANASMPYQYDVGATDENGDTLSYSLVTAPVGMSINSTTGMISWTPFVGQGGDVPVVVKVTDNGAGELSVVQEFTIGVSVNRAPNIDSTPITQAIEAKQYRYDVEASDTNAMDTLTYSLEQSPAGMTIVSSSGLITWTPTAAQVDKFIIEVKVTDNGAPDSLFDTQTFQLTVADKNVAPVITSEAITTANEGVEYQYQMTVTDETLNSLVFSLEKGPDGMSIDSVSGLISWTPGIEQIKPFIVTVKVTDGELFTEQEFVLTVASSNVAPSISSIAQVNATEAAVYTYDVNANDENSGDTLSYSLVLFPVGMSINENTGVISWTPTKDQVGNSNVTVKVTDNGYESLSDEQTFTIAVSEMNVAPVVTSEPVTLAYGGVAYLYDVDATDANAADELSYSLVTNIAGMTIDTVTGIVGWTPSDEQVGVNSVTVKVTDNGLGSLMVEHMFTINVVETNVAPVFTSVPINEAYGNVGYTYDVDATDANASDELAYSLTTSIVGMSIDTNTGVISWVPNDSQVGLNSVVVKVTDNGFGLLTADHTFNIDVVAANIAPVVSSLPVTTANPRATYLYDVEVTDENELTFALDSVIDGMTIDSSTGVISWVPTIEQTGANEVTFSVTDNGVPALSVSSTFTINVAENNLPPLFTTEPVVVAEAEVEYIYVFAVEDPTEDALSVVVNMPEGMVFDEVTNTLTWTPTIEQLAAGPYPVEITVTDDGVPVETTVQAFSVGVLDLEPPSTPVDVIARSAEETQINLNWSPATDNGGVAGYYIWRNGGIINQNNPVLINAVDEADGTYTHLDRNRSVGTEYIYEVQAFDGAGNVSEKSQAFAVIPQSLVFDDTFAESSSGWVVIDDGFGASSWSTSSGEFIQSSERGMLIDAKNRRAALENKNTYHIGTYAYHPGLQWLSDYRLSLDMTPIKQPGYDLFDDGHAIGVMFRYQNQDNYYRVSLNSEFGYARFERKLDGVFSTLAVDARGYRAEGQSIAIEIEVVGDLMQIYIDGEPRFATSDASFSKGGPALYTMDGGKFSNIVITPIDESAASVVIDQPEAYTAQTGSDIAVSAVALNVNGGNVEFTIDGSACDSASEVSPGYFTSTCTAITASEHTIVATLFNGGGTAVVEDSNVKVGSSGDVRIVIGDSLSNGVLDTFRTDNQSSDGKVIAEQGYVAVLQDLLGEALTVPQIIFNEAIPGDTSTDLANDRLSSILERHPDATIAQVFIGINDASMSRAVSTSKMRSNIQRIINVLTSAGVTPIFAQISPSYDDDLSDRAAVNGRIESYNAILLNDFPDEAVGPDFYSYFTAPGAKRESLYVDKLHFNGLAHMLLAHLWENALTGGGSLPSRADLPLVLEAICVRIDSIDCQSPLLYKQDLMEEGSPYYVDSDDNVVAIPSVLNGGVWLRTESANVDNSRDDHLSFNVDRDVDVYIAYDSAATTPDWMADFTDIGNSIDVSNSVSTMSLYRKSYVFGVDTAPDGTIELGGNLATGASGATANYIAIIKE